MAKKRMISSDVVGTDRFQEMPMSARLLYYELNRFGDDDGFVSNSMQIVRGCGCSIDDLKLLIAKGYVYRFESGLCVLLDWKINNYIRKDRYTPTIHAAEKAMLCVQNDRYSLRSSIDCTSGVLPGIPSGIPTVYTEENRLEENRLEENRLEENRLEEESAQKRLEAYNKAMESLQRKAGFQALLETL